MLNMPLLAPQPAQSAAAAPRKSADARQENGGFSDVYDDLDRANERPAEDGHKTAEARSERSEDAPVEGESTTNKNNSSSDSSDKETSKDADFAAIEAPDNTEAEAPALQRGPEKRAGQNATESAAIMRMSSQTQNVTDAAKPEMATAIAQAQTGAPIVKQASGAAQTVATAKAAETAQVTEGKASQLTAEAPEGLDPMQVQVRNKGTQSAQAQVSTPVMTPAQKAAADQLMQEVSPRAAARADSDVDTQLEPSTSKADTAAAPTASATQQMQARAIMEQVQAGTQSAMIKGAESAQGQGADAVIPAALDDNSLSPRGIMSAQEAASQARLANSAPNPAYVVRQVSNAVKASDKNLIELTMDPPELGKVRMSLAETGGVMAVTISADSQATTELMRRHMDLLRKDFMEMGYQDVSFSFEQGGSDASGQQTQMSNGFGQGGEPGSGQGESASGDGTDMTAAESLAAQQNSHLSAASSGVDIRI